MALTNYNYKTYSPPKTRFCNTANGSKPCIISQKHYRPFFNTNHTTDTWETEWITQGGFTSIVVVSLAPTTLAYKCRTIISKNTEHVLKRFVCHNPSKPIFKRPKCLTFCHLNHFFLLPSPAFSSLFHLPSPTPPAEMEPFSLRS